MPVNVRVTRLDLYDDDGIGPAKGELHLTISDDAVNADAASLGAGSIGKVVRVKLPRAKWLALMGDLKRIKGETLPGSLDALCPVAEEP